VSKRVYAEVDSGGLIVISEFCVVQSPRKGQSCPGLPTMQTISGVMGAVKLRESGEVIQSPQERVRNSQCMKSS